MDFVRAQSRVERVLFKNLPGSASRFLLTGRKRVETLPKTLRRFEAVFHSAARGGGLAPLNTVSMSAKRPASASAMPCLNDSGIQESSFSTTNLATCARSFAGSALNCSINSVALTARTYTDKRSATSLQRHRLTGVLSRSTLGRWPIAQRFFTHGRPCLGDKKIKFAGSRVPGHLPVPIVIHVQKPAQQLFSLTSRKCLGCLLDLVHCAHAQIISRSLNRDGCLVEEDLIDIKSPSSVSKGHLFHPNSWSCRECETELFAHPLSRLGLQRRIAVQDIRES